MEHPNLGLRSARRVAAAILFGVAAIGQAQAVTITVTRIDARPQGHPLDSGGLDPILDGNIEHGMFPSLIRVPDWIPVSERPAPNANYYLYYGTHSGKHIRMAWSDSITGVWTAWNPAGGARAWGDNGNHTGAPTPGRGVMDMTLGDPSPPIKLPKGGSANPGDVFDLDKNPIEDHYSSPEVIVDHANKRLVMFGHGHHRTANWFANGSNGRSHNGFVATSKYGLNFNLPRDGGEPGGGLRDVVVNGPYTRIVQIEGEKNGKRVVQTMGFANGGAIHLAPLFTAAGAPATFANADDVGGYFNPPDGYDGSSYYWPKVSGNPISGVARHPRVIPSGDFTRFAGDPIRRTYRHVDVWHSPEHDRNTVYVFYHAARDMPESILMVRLSLEGLSEEERLDPTRWKPIDEQERLILQPETDWEGREFELKPSQTGAQSFGRVLRDPQFFLDDGKLYIVYVGGGERNIGIAELKGIVH